MIEPIVLDYLAQIFVKHYKNEPEQAAENAMKFLEIIDLYGLQLIRGKWQDPPRPKTSWEIMLEAMDESAEREPWKAYEIND